MLKETRKDESRMTHVAMVAIVYIACLEHGMCGSVPKPVGFWKFNEHQHGSDLSGNNNDAIVSGVSLVDGPNGEEKDAYKFAGTSDSFIRIPNNGALDSESYTIVMQFMPGTVAGALFGWMWDEAMLHWSTHVWMNLGPGDFFFRLNRDDTLVDAVHSVNAFPLDKWSFAAVTYDYASGETKSWKDGKVIGSLSYPKVKQRLSNDVLIAKSSLAGDKRFWDGKVACYQFYDRALNQEEIIEAQKLCSLGSIPKPVGFWQFNEDQHGSDLSCNNNDAIVSGVTLVDGPNGEEKGAYKFAGTSDSFIRIPNNGALDNKSYTIVMQFMPGTVAGALFGWMWDEALSQWSTHVWMNLGTGDFFFRLKRDDGLVDAVKSVNAFPLDKWSFAAATYDYASGETKSWKDGKVIGSLTYPKLKQRLSNDVLIAKSSRAGDKRFWDGKVACYQFYDRALNQEEILEAQKLCSLGKAC